MRAKKLTHVDARGTARMVDVGAKPATARAAEAAGEIRFSREAFALLRGNRLAKGDAVAVARIAGIAAGKRTSEWVPLCHVVPLDHLDVDIRLDARRRAAVVHARAAARWTTGVEMEALVAVAAALLALYDMAKSVDRGASIGGIGVVSKSGGRSGTWTRGSRRT